MRFFSFNSKKGLFFFGVKFVKLGVLVFELLSINGFALPFLIKKKQNESFFLINEKGT